MGCVSDTRSRQNYTIFQSHKSLYSVFKSQFAVARLVLFFACFIISCGCVSLKSDTSLISYELSLLQ